MAKLERPREFPGDAAFTSKEAVERIAARLSIAE